jgi:hypothetical protein
MADSVERRRPAREPLLEALPAVGERVAPGAGARRLPAGRTLLLMALLVALVAVLARPAPQQPATGAGAARSGSAEAVPLAAELAVSRALGADEHSFWVRPGLVAQNAPQGLRVRFARSGVTIRGAGGRLGLSLVAVGRGAQLRPSPPVAPLAGANRVSYRRSGLLEWYANGPFGLEQGLTLARRPAGAGPLSFAFGLSGSLRPHLDGATTLLLRADGGRRLEYTALSAVDARGRPLPARFELRGGRVLIRVDDAGAVYPLRVDPVIATLSPSEGGGDVGVSIAASGSTLVAGAPGATVGANPAQGAAYVFVEPPSGWTEAHQNAKLTAKEGVAGDQLGATVAISQPASGPSTIVAGAPGATVGTNPAQGAAYVFVEPPGGWSEPPQEAKLTAKEGAGGDKLGSSVAVGTTSSGAATVAAGAPGATVESKSAQGAAYVFVEPTTGHWASTMENEKLVNKAGQEKDELGGSVAIPDDGATIVAGAPGATVGTNPAQGAAYVFGEPAGGWTTAGEPTLATLTAAANGGGRLGWSVAASGPTIAAGAPDANEGLGAVFVFSEPGGGWQTATQTAELTSSDGGASLGDTSALAASPSCVSALTIGGSAVYDFVPPAAGWASTADASSLAFPEIDATQYSLAASSTTGFAGDAQREGKGAVFAFSLSQCPETTQGGGTTATSSPPSGGATGTTAAPPPKAVVSPAATLILGCSRAKLAVLDVVEKGTRVTLTGAAIASLVGDPVRIIFNNKKQVASTTVGKNGFFSVTAPLPPANVRNTNNARYLAEVGTIKSLNLKLTRRLILDPPTVSGGKVRLSGELTRPLGRPISPISVGQQTTCTSTRTVKRFKPATSGRFSITVAAPAGKTAAIYRLTSKVPANATSTKQFPTFSLPEVAQLGAPKG